MYSLIQFDEKAGGTVALVSTKWITSTKDAVYWPAVKNEKNLNNLLKRDQTPEKNWKQYGVARFFLETDDLERARRKLKLVEDTSDLQSEVEDVNDELRPKRKINKPRRLFTSSDDDNEYDDEDDLKLPRPPILKKCTEVLSGKSTSTNMSAAAVLENIESSVSEPTITPSQTAIVDLQGIETLSIVSGPSNASSQTDIQDRSSSASSQTGFQESVIGLLSEIITQNNLLINLMKDKGLTIKLDPVFKFPCTVVSDVTSCEEILIEKVKYENLVSYLKSLGGRDASDKTTRILRHILLDELASQYNFYGKRSNKLAFADLKLRHCITDAVKETTCKTDKDIEEYIKTWLKHAPERVKNKEKKIGRRTNITEG